jgi:hypothetical protein
MLNQQNTSNTGHNLAKNSETVEELKEINRKLERLMCK